ncbi:MAG TPA: hypothetical protein VG734_18800 [Lacunisphaera sp.]|nr:hypothetical protein [Lacunisphaera sp.]
MRKLPDLAGKLNQQLAQSIALCDVADQIVALGAHRAAGIRVPRYYRINIYEAAFLRGYAQWETFLEEAMIRYIAGFKNSAGQLTLKPGLTFHPTIAAAKRHLYSGSDYLLWHKPQTTIARSQRYFVNGLHETVTASATNDLLELSHIRHRIAHDQADARAKFDALTRLRGLGVYQGSRPGLFLYDGYTGVGGPCRWIEKIFSDLMGLAAQITP